MNAIIYGVAFVLTFASVIALFVCWDSISTTHGRIAPREQMRERTPWPPPPLPAQTVDATYRKPEMLALPRGDR